LEAISVNIRLKFLCKRNFIPNISQASRSNQEERKKKNLKIVWV
jgi:hypothetical protein